jgi:hypothetical protein
MIEKKTVIDRIEVDRFGFLHVRFGLLLVEDGVECGCTWHRSGVEPGGSVDAMIATVNNDITTRPALRAAPIDMGRVDELKAIQEIVHTPARVAAYRRAVLDAEAADLAAAVSTVERRMV